MKRGTHGWVAGGLLALLACSAVWARAVRRDPPRNAKGTNGTESGLAYTVMPSVPDGGRIEGTVRFTGTVPTLAAMTVNLEHNPANRACGASVPNPALIVEGAGRMVRNTVVSLSNITRGLAPTPRTLEVDQQRCAFEPHVVALGAGSSLRFANHDPGVLHNVHGYYSLAGDETLFNLGTAPGLSITRRIDRDGIHRVVCDVGHTWMLLYMHAFKHPYFAITGADGRFSIGDIPPGTYKLRVWHEGWSITGTDARSRPVWSAPVELEHDVTITARGRVRLDVQLSSAGAFTVAPARGR